MLDIEKELLLDSLPGMAYRCGVNAPWTMHYVSPGVRFVCSYPPEDFTVGRVEWGPLIVPTYMASIDAELSDAIANRRQYNLRYEIADPVLGMRWLNDSGQAVYNDEGDAEALVGFIIDVTDQEQVQQKLREAEQSYALAARATGEIIWDRNLDTSEVRRIVPAGSVFYSAAKEGAGGHDWWESRVHPDDASVVQQGVQLLLEEDRTYWSAEYRFQRPDGTYADIWDQGFLVPSDSGGARRMVGAMQDISQRKAAEAQLERLRAELIHLSRVSAMGAMASTLAHELNQPLSAIHNYAAGSAWIIESGADISELSFPIAEIGKNALRAGEVIRRLREMTKKGKITKEAFVPDQVIEEAGALARVGACRALNLQYGFHDGRAVMGDPIQIQQVLINLIRNACEAVADGSNQNVLVMSRIVGGNTLITVEDDGPGIPAEALPTLFDAFVTTKEGGMGVGLSISRTIIEAHEGRIWAENRPEGGARFSFTLPLAEVSTSSIN